MKECPICGGEVKKIETTLSLFDGKIQINPITAFECPQCNEVYIDEEESKKIDSLANIPIYRRQIEEIRKYQLRLRRKIGFSGRSLVVRIPKDIERALSLQDGDEVEIYPEGKNKIVLEKMT